MQSSQNPKAVLVSSRRNHADVCKSWKNKLLNYTKCMWREVHSSVELTAMR